LLVLSFLLVVWCSGVFGVGLGGFIPSIFTLFSLPLSASLYPKLRVKYNLYLSLWLRWLSRLLRGFASIIVMTERLEV
jgi:hypothetical protein